MVISAITYASVTEKKGNLSSTQGNRQAPRQPEGMKIGTIFLWQSCNSYKQA